MMLRRSICGKAPKGILYFWDRQGFHPLIMDRDSVAVSLPPLPLSVHRSIVPKRI